MAIKNGLNSVWSSTLATIKKDPPKSDESLLVTLRRSVYKALVSEVIKWNQILRVIKWGTQE